VIACKAFLRREIYYMARFRNEKFRKQVREMVAEFKPDVVHFDYILTTQYRDCVPPGIGTVASINDSFTFSMENMYRLQIEKSFFRKLYRRVQYYQVRHFEKTFYPRFDIVHTMTEKDAKFLRNLNPQINTVAIPNGVLIDELLPSAHKPPADHVIFVAKLTPVNVEPLIHFLEICWSKIRSVKPQAVLHIVGRETPNLQAVYEIAQQVGGVQFEGFVENLSDAYSKAGIAIAPIDKNCGLVNKAIEGMAAGLCVVGFNKTFEGIPEAVNGENCISVEGYPQMAEAILQLMNNSEKLGCIQKAARETAVRCFSWDSRRIRYQKMYEQAMNLAKSHR
jgi:glycosyltransferase involved in cell wall biosynthesis